MLDADRTKLLRLLITVPEGRLMEAVTFPARETDLDIGCKTIGIAGTQEKLEWIMSDLGFDHGINYKTEIKMF